MNPPKMPIHIGDLLRDTGHLGPDEFGVYMLLLFHHWSTGNLPDDDKRLATIARMAPAQWKRVRPVLVTFFEEGWRHGRIEKDLATSHANYEKRAKAGSEGGKAKAAAKQNSSKTVAMLEPESSNALATDNLLPKEDAAAPPPDPEKELFQRGRAVFGNAGGGLVAKLLKSKNGNIALARAAVEHASTKANPREYIGKIISNPKQGEMAWPSGMEGVI